MKVSLTVIEGPDRGRAFTFDRRDRFFVGRAPDCQLCVSGDPEFSRHHFRLEIDPPNVLLVDAGSANGTYVNDERVREAALRHGDRIRGGATVLRVEVDAGIGLDETAAAPGGLDTLLGLAPAAPARRDVRCLRCGSRAVDEEPRAASEGVAFFCGPCQGELRRAPILAPGFQIVKELGAGTMGCVYLALDEAGSQRFAVKQILPRAALSQRVRQSFLREAAEQARLDHPRIVRAHGLVESRPGIFCMVMEYVEGESADRLLARHPAGLAPALAVDLVCQALEGLAYAHARGVVHRDLKEQNLLVGQDARGAPSVKVADFGLAKSYAQSGASGFTRTGDIGGTIPYMAPEQIIDFKRVLPAADLYSMGATLYRLLSGCYTHDFGAGGDAILIALEQPIVPLRRRNPAVPAPLAHAVEKALSRKPEDRYKDADAMRRALRTALETTSYTIVTDVCEGIHDCIMGCPAECIHRVEGKRNAKGTSYVVIDPAACIACNACLALCPIEGAILDHWRPERQRDGSRGQ